MVDFVTATVALLVVSIFIGSVLSSALVRSYQSARLNHEVDSPLTDQVGLSAFYGLVSFLIWLLLALSGLRAVNNLSIQAEFIVSLALSYIICLFPVYAFAERIKTPAVYLLLVTLFSIFIFFL